MSILKPLTQLMQSTTLRMAIRWTPAATQSPYASTTPSRARSRRSSAAFSARTSGSTSSPTASPVKMMGQWDPGRPTLKNADAIFRQALTSRIITASLHATPDSGQRADRRSHQNDAGRRRQSDGPGRQDHAKMLPLFWAAKSESPLPVDARRGARGGSSGDGSHRYVVEPGARRH